MNYIGGETCVLKELTERQRLMARLNELDAREKAEKEARQQTANAAYEALPWIYGVREATYPSWGRMETHKGVQVWRQRDPVLYQEWVTKFGKHPDDNRTQGMFYFRTDENILTQEGGGTYVLKTPKLCSDEEWAAIINNNIPEKFKR